MRTSGRYVVPMTSSNTTHTPAFLAYLQTLSHADALACVESGFAGHCLYCTAELAVHEMHEGLCASCAPFRDVAPAADELRYYLVHGVYGADNVDCASLVLAGNKRDAVLAMQQHWTSFALDNVRRVDRSDFHPATYVIGA